jgi:hypothetical protein
MKATEFEYRHERLIHNLIVAAAVLTYFIQRDDIVWRFVKNRPQLHAMERYVFLVATLFIAAGAGSSTWAHTKADGGRSFRHLGDFIYAIGLGSFFFLSGFIILVVGEGISPVAPGEIRGKRFPAAACCGNEVWAQLGQSNSAGSSEMGTSSLDDCVCDHSEGRGG